MSRPLNADSLKLSSQIFLSPIVVAELDAGLKGSNELAVVDNSISFFPTIPRTSEIAKAGGLYKRDHGKSHGVGLADAIFAATADKEKAEIKTLHVKHCSMIRGFKSAYKK